MSERGLPDGKEFADSLDAALRREGSFSKVFESSRQLKNYYSMDFLNNHFCFMPYGDVATEARRLKEAFDEFRAGNSLVNENVGTQVKEIMEDMTLASLDTAVSQHLSDTKNKLGWGLNDQINTFNFEYWSRVREITRVAAELVIT